MFSGLIYTFVWLLLQIFSMVRFTVNLICFAINSRLFFFAITRIFRKVRLQLITLLYSVMIVNVILWYFFRLLELSGDIEFNPEPMPDSSQSFSICHWNLNSMSAHNYSKISLLTAYISIHDFDVICLSETYLTSTADISDGNLKIPGYIMYRVDHPSDVKRGGVCIYYKTILPLKILSTNFLQECINFEVCIGNKICRFIHLYRTPSQSQDEFHDFLRNLGMNLDDSFNSNPFLTTVIGDFNAKSKNWSEGDRSTIEGSKIEFLTSQFGLSQIIKEPTHILENSSSCIDLIFTTQPNMVLESGVHHSLHQNCHHQIIFAKFNLKVYYPPPYERTIFHYSQANVDHIQQAINLFDWENVFLNTDVNAQVFIFSNTVLNILNNYIPYETKICDDRDPPWITTKIKELISQKNKLYSRIKKGNNSVLNSVLFLIYLNDLPNGLNSNVKLFADDTSLFSVVHNITDSANLLNSDLSKINEWALQWKMSFNPDPIKQAQEVIFSRKTSKRNHPGLTFNNNIVNLTTKHKHLGMIFDSKLSFDEHLKSALKKISKTVGLLRKFQGILPRTSLITIYKSFARPHLDYGDIICDQTFNESFHQRIESIQYNAAIAMTGAIRGTSSEKLYQELGLESLRSRRWLRKLCLFYKIYKNK